MSRLGRALENTSEQILVFTYSLYIQAHTSHLVNFRNVMLKSMLAELHLKDMRHEKGLKLQL